MGLFAAGYRMSRRIDASWGCDAARSRLETYTSRAAAAMSCQRIGRWKVETSNLHVIDLMLTQAQEVDGRPDIGT